MLLVSSGPSDGKATHKDFGMYDDNDLMGKAIKILIVIAVLFLLCLPPAVWKGLELIGHAQ